MILSGEDVQQFFRIHRALMFFVNRRLQVIPGPIATPEAYSALAPDVRIKVHQALMDHIELIDAFEAENPSHLNEADLAIARSWRDFVTGTFTAFRQLRPHMILLSSTEPVVAYGVVALFNTFDELLGPTLPQMLKTTLLPFKGRIVYDGLLAGSNITLGPGIRRRLNEEYREAKASGIITSLPAGQEPAAPAPAKATSTAQRAKRGESPAPTPQNLAHDRIVALIDAFCRDHLDDEYRAICRQLAGVLARKRPSPLVRGKPEAWAAGIVRVIGMVNFLNDPSQPHHMKMTDIDAGFGVSEATGSAKSKAIRDLVKFRPFDFKWTLPSRMEQNPLAWMIEVNGLIADARRLPREIQEEAFREGLIPYLPGTQELDRAED